MTAPNPEPARGAFLGYEVIAEGVPAAASATTADDVYSECDRHRAQRSAMAEELVRLSTALAARDAELARVIGELKAKANYCFAHRDQLPHGHRRRGALEDSGNAYIAALKMLGGEWP